LPGKIWSAGGEFKMIRDKEHFHNAYQYIRTKQESGTIVWSHRTDEDWIAHPEVGIVIMQPKHERTRIWPDLNAGV
jgi:sucrose-6-phosphate hydrolase SacC (GH32 family)